MSFVTQYALPFTQSAVLANGEIKTDFSWDSYTQGHDAILFFYPLNFTFVCPSELIALNNRYKEFEERATKVVAISIDSVYSHIAWRNTAIEQGGIAAVQYPIVADIDHKICKHYAVEHDSGVALRSVIIVDNCGIIRAQMTYDLPIGRNIDEILRVIDAIQFHREYGDVCPSGWERGNKGMKATADGVKDYLTNHIHDL